MSELVEFLQGGAEPLTLAEVKANCRIDDDLAADDDFIQNIIIPGARQQAETRAGSIIRPARYIQRLPKFPSKGDSIAITHGLVTAVESITYLAADGSGRQSLDPADFESTVIDRETLLAPIADAWPETGKSLRAVEITYTGGLSAADFTARYPSVRHWLLLAAGWAYDHRELFVTAKGAHGFQELPDDYVIALLDPIMLRTRF